MVNIKAIIPLAGKGTRLRPHTYSKPKPLLRVAGKPALGHILDSFKVLNLDKIVFITGDMDDQIKDYVGKNYTIETDYIKQTEALGDGHALSMAKDSISDDVIIDFVDTLFIQDIKSDIENIGKADGIVWTSKTNDPKRFGIVEVKNDIIVGLEEKPEKPKSDLAVIGLYYFKDSKLMFKYLDLIHEKGITSKGGEYRLADALTIMIKEGVKLKSIEVEKWLDTGKPETMFETNKYLLSNGKHNIVETDVEEKNSVIRSPVYIESGVEIKNSVVGPYVSIAKGTKIENSIITSSIIGEDAFIKNAVLEESLIGNKAQIIYNKKKLNVGDSTQILLSD